MREYNYITRTNFLSENTEKTLKNAEIITYINKLLPTH